MCSRSSAADKIMRPPQSADADASSKKHHRHVVRAKKWFTTQYLLVVAIGAYALTYTVITIALLTMIRDPQEHDSLQLQLSVPPITARFTTNFSFPSNDDRYKYYMGDWYNRSILQPKDMPCNEIEGYNLKTDKKTILWTVHELEKIVASKQGKDWQVNSYLNHSLSTLTANSTSYALDNDRRMILVLGDGHSKSKKLPAVAKTRFSKYAISKKTNRFFFDTIIWPVAIYRHYHPVDEYLQLQSEGKVYAWENKTSSLIWRGGFTGYTNDKPALVKNYPDGGWRIKVVRSYFHGNISNVDVAFKWGDGTLRQAGKYRDVTKLKRRTYTSMSDQLKYKYMLVIEGNDVATSLKWQLASNSVVFMARPTCVSYLMEDLLVPYVHYVPVKDDYSNILEMVEWARTNNDKCKWISEQATKYMEQLWLSEEGQRNHNIIKQKLGEAYHRQFGTALKSCRK